jgi:hypothetical protein
MLTGHEAIYFKQHNPEAVLCKFADPTQDAREDLSTEEAEDIAMEDPNLIYIVD